VKEKQLCTAESRKQLQFLLETTSKTLIERLTTICKKEK